MNNRNFDNMSREELAEMAKQGDSNALEYLTETNLGLVKSVVKRFTGRGYEAEDLFQVGSIGLIKAIHNFKAEFGVKFSTYAVPMIIGEVKRYMRDDGIIKVSRSIKELSCRAASAREALTAKTGEEPTVSEIAEYIGAAPEDVAAAFDATARPESIYAKSDDGNSEGLSLVEKLQSPENEENKIVNELLLASAIKDFSEREQKIVMLRYFRQKTQSQIAELLGISQVQVSRLEKRILNELKQKIADV